MSLYSIQAVLILDAEGKRILAKYYDHGTGVAVPQTEQVQFEKTLASKTFRRSGDIVIVNDHLIVYKQMADTVLIMVASLDENEALVYSAVVGLRDALDILLEHNVDKSTLFERYDRLSLALDESIDGGIILETDSAIIASRVTLKARDEPSLQNIDLSEKGIKNMFDFARGRLARAVKQQFAYD